MTNTHVAQASFNSGEWSPKLFARVDLQKYRSAAALLENFYVDYRGGASTRPGTKYVLQCWQSGAAVRLIPFQASFSVGYVLEFGQGYMRPFFQGSPVLEAALNITAATRANPCVITVPGNSFAIGQWFFVTGVNGMTQLNGRYFRVNAVAGNNITLGDLNGNPIDSTGYSTYLSSGTAARVYTISSPYNAADLHLLKFAQNVSQMIICHPSYPPYVLTLLGATNWTMLPIQFGTTATPPTANGIFATVAGGSVGYSYGVTSIDANGQESSIGAVQTITTQDMRTTAMTISVQWNAPAEAVSYNVYKATVTYFGAVPAGATYGFIGTTTGQRFDDSNISADFSQTPPISRNPFQGSGVAVVNVTATGTYTSVPTVTATGPATVVASLQAVLGVIGIPTVGSGGSGYVAGDQVVFSNGVVLYVASVSGGAVTSWVAPSIPPSSSGAVYSGSVPANPMAQVSTSGSGIGATANMTWGVKSVLVLNSGSGYLAPPTLVFAPGGATATAGLSTTSNGYPSVPGFFQQRLVLAAPNVSPQTFYMSQPGAYFNFDISTITQPEDAITGTLVSGQLSTIKAMVSQPTGLLVFTDRNSWLINGGSPGSAVSPSALVANAQSFNGISDVPPIISNFDILYVQAKGSIVRDSAYNIYANVYTGTDISALASHLFYGYTINEWAWAEEPYKLVWAVRSDGTMLTLTFLKEQEFIGWAHSVTQGSFESVAVVVETGSNGTRQDAVYTVVQRTINGNTVQYIERIADRNFPGGVADAWCVDAGINYTGAPATSFTGADHLAGATVTGLADGQIIPPFTMPLNGQFTLATPASKVTVGLPFTAKLQTLPLELGDPTVQGKVKKINSVDVRVSETLGLQIGSSFSTLTTMKDLVRGNVSSMLVGQPSQLITDLVTGDARTFLDPTYTVPGQYCIQQSLPYPATVLGVFPNITVGDGGQRG